VGQHGDAGDAVRGRGVARAVGQESVCGVLADGVDVESGGFDRLVVAVGLHCPADARGPECGVAGDAFGQLDGGDDVGNGEAAAGAQRASRGSEDAVLVRGEVSTPLEITQSTEPASTGGSSM
jgi:hypothetical protein